MKRHNTMKISILTTGGTIDKLYHDQLSEYQVGEPRITEFLRGANVTLDFQVRSLLRKDSLDLTDQDRERICRAVAADESDRIVVTHGTDTMIETAKELRGIPGKVIVLVGAMQPACHLVSDAAFNIGFAVAAVQFLPRGVHIAMNGRVFDPCKACKNRDHNRFEAVGG